MTKIVELTKEQEEKLPGVEQEWIEIGLSTITDRNRAERAINKMYEIGELPPPKHLFWFEDPQDAIQRILELSNHSNTDVLSNSICAAIDMGWMAFYWAMREIVGLVEEVSEMEGLFEFAQSAGWLFPYENAAFVVDKPKTIRVDERGNLHSEDGPAMEFAGATRIYAWHGIELSEDLFTGIATGKILPRQIEKIDNTEIRRAAIGLFGEGRYLDMMGAEVVDEVALDDTSEPLGVRGARLLRMNVGALEPVLVIRMINTSNGEVYYETVPPNMTTCKQAIAWHHWDAPENYFPDWEA